MMPMSISLNSFIRVAVVAGSLSLVQGSARAQSTPSIPSDSTAIVTTVDRFHQLLAKGDSLAAVKLLAPDLIVLESGDLETRAEYLQHHLQADIEFAKGVPGERRVKGFAQAGDAAWLSSETTSHGTFRGRAIHSRGAELIVLSRSGTEWKIRAIHWSSHRITP